MAADQSLAGELLQQLKGQVAALAHLIDALGLDPETTGYVVEGVAPNGHRTPLARVPYAELRRQAEAVIAAAEKADVPAPRKRGPLRAADAEALRLDLGASTLLVLVRDRASRAAGALTSIFGTTLVGHGTAQTLWSAVATCIRDEAAAAESSSPSESQEPTQ
ncbi:hypothetical protein [Methylorubrum zatmanii]